MVYVLEKKLNILFQYELMLFFSDDNHMLLYFLFIYIYLFIYLFIGCRTQHVLINGYIVIGDMLSGLRTDTDLRHLRHWKTY